MKVLEARQLGKLEQCWAQLVCSQTRQTRTDSPRTHCQDGFGSDVCTRTATRGITMDTRRRTHGGVDVQEEL